MDYRFGYVANCLSIGLTASHTCRVAGATPERLEHLIAENLAELEQILLFNEAHGIQVFRVGSLLVPLATHPVNRVQWWRTFDRDLAHLGRIARRSYQRLSMHPSPAGASLSSARPLVREAARAELSYSTRVLDLLEQGPEARVVVHVGGAAPDRAVALAAAHRFLDESPRDVLWRVAVEHDDRIWSAREVLPLAREHGLPFVADNLHNAVLESDPPMPLHELIREAGRTWHALGLRPKYHLASQARNHRAGAHADRIHPEDARAFLDALSHPADLMLEAKEKELALFALRRDCGLEGEALALR